MKNKKILILVFIISIVFSINAMAEEKGEISLTFDEELPEEYSDFKKVISLNLKPRIEVWHSSGGYWSYQKIKIFDGALKGNITQYLEEEVVNINGDNGFLLQSPQTPDEIRKALDEGKDVIVQIKTYTGAPIENFIRYTDEIDKHSIIDKGEKLEFKTYPRFSYERTPMGEPYAIGDFGLDNNIELPFVKDSYGENGWSIYNAWGGRDFSGEWGSYSSWQEWNNAGGNKISYQKMLKDSSGRMEAGHDIETKRGVYKSENIGVGDIGVFKAGGATGLAFNYPLQYNYYIKEEGKIEQDVIVTDLVLYKDIDGVDIEEIGRFKRTLDPTDPLNPDKQSIIADSTNPDNAFSIDKDAKYYVWARYQFVSVKEGPLNLNTPGTLTHIQSLLNTFVDNNRLLRAEAFDDNAFKSGVFDVEETVSGNRSPRQRLYNLEEETFAWEFKVPDTTDKYVKIAGLIPDGLFSEEANQNLENDWAALYAKIGGESDLSLSSLRLYDSEGKEVTYVEPNESYTANVVVNHLIGDEPIGIDNISNPKVEVKYKAMEIDNKIALPENPQITSEVLDPGKKITMPESDSFVVHEGQVRICASLDEKHHNLGFNFDLSNDIICKDFAKIKNYSVTGFKATNANLNLGEDDNYLRNEEIKLDFIIGNETHKDAPKNLPSSVYTEIFYRGKVVWDDFVSVNPGSKKSVSIKITEDIYKGDNEFSVVVNRSKTPPEFKPGVSNPYLDNVAKLSIKATEYEECQTCMTSEIRTENEWGERWYFTEKWGTIKTKTYTRCGTDDKWSRNWYSENRSKCGCDKRGESAYDKCRSAGGSPDDCSGQSLYRPCLKADSCWVTECDSPRSKISASYEYCETDGSRSTTEDVKDYYELYNIKDIEFGSKYNEDKYNSRYVSVKNGGEGAIKAGYGFELRITTEYKTNRHIEEPVPSYFHWSSKIPNWRGDYHTGDSPYSPRRKSSGYCDSLTRRPTTSSVWSPSQIYVEMPYGNRSGGNVCYILNGSRSGPWYNHRTTFQLPKRTTPDGESEERRIYINKDAESNNNGDRKSLPIKIVTPRPDESNRFYGYNPGGYQINISSSHEKGHDTYLHDCDEFYLVIYPNDDIKTHITQ